MLRTISTPLRFSGVHRGEIPPDKKGEDHGEFDYRNVKYHTSGADSDLYREVRDQFGSALAAHNYSYTHPDVERLKKNWDKVQRQLGAKGQLEDAIRRNNSSEALIASKDSNLLFSEGDKQEPLLEDRFVQNRHNRKALAKLHGESSGARDYEAAYTFSQRMLVKFHEAPLHTKNNERQAQVKAIQDNKTLKPEEREKALANVIKVEEKTKQTELAHQWIEQDMNEARRNARSTDFQRIWRGRNTRKALTPNQKNALAPVRRFLEQKNVSAGIEKLRR